MSDSPSMDRLDRAQALLEAQAERHARGEEETLEVLIAAHPDLEKELRVLSAACVDIAQGFAEEAERSRLLREQVERMLADANAGAGSFAARYVIQEEVGQGGMGVVLRVHDRKLERPLAMKVILGQAEARRSGDSPPISPHQLQRFLAEARITSQLEHPGIVPVHEIGVDEHGRVYFTMKLVKGRTLADVLQRHRAHDTAWTTAKVLGVIQRVCDAVAFAHEQGVIHRDLKPQNVMVGDFGEVYVMDWGLARRIEGSEEMIASQTDEALARELSLTREGRIVGTPCYMPPEQARGEIAKLGAPSDVYAIGAILYEVVAGAPPYTRGSKNASGNEILARIEAGPPEPISSKRLSPDLLAIIEQAMRRDPSERYPSVRDLQQDLERFLSGRTVRALRTGAWIEARKWVGRNKASAASLGVALLALVVGIGSTTLESHRAERHASETDQVAGFLGEVLAAATPDKIGRAFTESMKIDLAKRAQWTGRTSSETSELVAQLDHVLTNLNPSEIARSVLVREVLGYASNRMSGSLNNARTVEAALHHRLGTILDAWGDPSGAESELRNAVCMRRVLLGDGHPAALQSMHELGGVLRQLGKPIEAAELQRVVLAAAVEDFGEDDRRTLVARNNLALSVQAMGDLAGAEVQFSQGLERSRRNFGNDDKMTLTFIHNLGSIATTMGKHSDARDLLLVAFERRRLLNGAWDPDAINSGVSLAVAYSHLGQDNEAESLAKEMIWLSERVFGEASSNTLIAVVNLGQILCQQERWAEAEPLLRRAAESYPLVLGPVAQETLFAQRDLADMFGQTGRLPEAEAIIRGAFNAACQEVGAEDRRALWMRRELVRVLRPQAEYDEAIRLVDDGLRLSSTHWGWGNEETHLQALCRAKTLIAAARFRDAEIALQEIEKQTAESPLTPENTNRLQDLWTEVKQTSAGATPLDSSEGR